MARKQDVRWPPSEDDLVDWRAELPEEPQVGKTRTDGASAAGPAPALYDRQSARSPGAGAGGADPDALYAQGMAYYRRRHWRLARDSFERVKAVQPNRRGIDALLRELDIFLQLESVEAGEPAPLEDARPHTTVVPPVDESGLGRVAQHEPAREMAEASPRGRGRPLLAFFGLVGAILIVGLVYLFSSGTLTLGAARESEENLRNLGQAYLIAQQYDKALSVYARLRELLPADPEVLNGLEKAKNGLYEEGLVYEQAGDYAQALARYQPVSQVDPGHEGVLDRIATLQARLELDERFEEAEQHLARQAYSEAEKVLLWIRGQDAEYRPGTISDGLYQAYMGRANQAISWAAQELEPAVEPQANAPRYDVTDGVLARVREAMRDYDKAAVERRAIAAAQKIEEPSEAQEAAALTSRLHEGLERYNDWAWAESIVALEAVYVADPDYMLGKVALILCDAHLHLGDFYYDRGELKAAVTEFETMGHIEACDQRLAEARAQTAGLLLTPTSTPSPTQRPTVTPTRTPRPTMTTVPTYTPVPPPVIAQPSSGGDGGSSSGGSSGGGSSGGGSSGGGSSDGGSSSDGGGSSQPAPEPTKPPPKPTSKPTPKPRK